MGEGQDRAYRTHRVYRVHLGGRRACRAVARHRVARRIPRRRVRPAHPDGQDRDRGARLIRGARQIRSSPALPRPDLRWGRDRPMVEVARGGRRRDGVGQP
jgi:hypothetical protein